MGKGGGDMGLNVVVVEMKNRAFTFWGKEDSARVGGQLHRL